MIYRLNKDVLLYILTFVPLEDGISLTLVSRQLQELATEKTFWIHLLETAKKTRPLPCPDDTDLSQQDAGELRRLALHTIRREHNLSSQTSVIKCRKSTRFELGRGHTIIHSIPGTPRLVLHSQKDGTALCYDVAVGRIVHSVHIGHSIFHISLALKHNDAHLIALLVTEDFATDYIARWPSLLVLEVHSDGRMDICFRVELENGYTFGQLFLTAQIVGLLRVFDMETLDIVAFNLSSKAGRVIHTDTLYNAQMGAYLDHSNLYIVKDRSQVSSNVYFCPSYLLPYADSHEGLIYMPDVIQWNDQGIRFWDGIDASYSGLETWIESLGVLTATPVRGPALITLHHINVDEEMNPRAINIRFWSYSEQRHGDVPTSQRLAPAHTLNISGMVATGSTLSRNNYLMACSDLSLLLVVAYRGSRSVRLVQYDPWAISSTIHLLDSPGVELNNVSSIALDDHRGTIALTDRTGFLYLLEYV